MLMHVRATQEHNQPLLDQMQIQIFKLAYNGLVCSILKQSILICQSNVKENKQKMWRKQKMYELQDYPQDQHTALHAL